MKERVKLTRSITVKMPVIKNIQINVNPHDSMTEIYEWVNENGEKFTSYRFVIGLIKGNEIASPFETDNRHFYLYSAADRHQGLYEAVEDAAASYDVSPLDIIAYDLKNGDLWYVESNESFNNVGLTKA